MAFYEPTQRLDFLYIHDHNAIYVKATVTVPLDVNESFLSPPPGDIIRNGNKIDIKLRVTMLASNDDSYSQTTPIPVKIFDTEFPSIPDKAAVASVIGQNIYEVTSAVFKDGEEKGKVTTISQNVDIEII